VVDTPSGVATASTTNIAPVSPSALDQLRAGEVSVDGYLDLKVSEATAHLGALPPQALEAIRSTLRERLASDPMFVDLVRAATGSVPSPVMGDD
jgi:hypothetical protein